MDKITEHLRLMDLQKALKAHRWDKLNLMKLHDLRKEVQIRINKIDY